MALVNLGGKASPTDASAFAIGAGKCAFIVPITGANASEIASAAREIESSAANLVEWRVDHLDSLESPMIQGALQVLKRETTRPILATFRTKMQGGQGNPSESLRIAKVILEAGVDALDIEDTDPAADEIAELAYSHAAVPVLSVHDFAGTPGVEALLKKLNELQDRVISWHGDAVKAARRADALRPSQGRADVLEHRGPGIIKIACIPNKPMDALNIAVAARRFADVYQKAPFIALSMGTYGEITRAFAGALGCSATFVSLAEQASAPGQIDVDALASFADATSALNIPPSHSAQ